MMIQASGGEDMNLARSRGGRFSIGPTALETVLRYVQDDPIKPESGGVLLGRHILDSGDIVVDRVTTPEPGDYQGRFRFFRARHRHQELIDAAWRESGGTCTYLGEWHTHPEFAPVPSIIDQLDWRGKLLVDRFSEHLFFVIVGMAELRVWEGYQRGSHLLPLRAAN